MDYSESILYLKACIKNIESALNKRQFEHALNLSQEIIAEAKQLDDTVFAILNAQEEL